VITAIVAIKTRKIVIRLMISHDTRCYLMEALTRAVDRTLLHVTACSRDHVLAATFATQQLHYVRRDLTYRATHFVVNSLQRFTMQRAPRLYPLRCKVHVSESRELATLFGTLIRFGITEISA